MVGGQTALEIGLASAFLASAFGTVYGAVAGFLGGFWDAVLMRVVDTMLAIPALLLLLLLAVIFSSSVPVLIIILALFAWLGPARLVRGETLTLRTREYVQAARLMGAGSVRIVLRHIVPNALGTVVVNTTFQIADAVLALASLSFLGLAAAPGGQLGRHAQRRHGLPDRRRLVARLPGRRRDRHHGRRLQLPWRGHRGSPWRPRAHLIPHPHVSPGAGTAG